MINMIKYHLQMEKKLQLDKLLEMLMKIILTRIQIRETIRSHFEKEKELYKKGIKVLSLFFIDEVAKYKVYDDEKKHIKENMQKYLKKNIIIYIMNIRIYLDEDYKKYLDSFKR